MKKLILILISLCCFTTVKALTTTEVAKLYQDAFTPYILETIPQSYIVLEREYGNSYTITYSYNPFLGNGFIINALTPLSKIDGFVITKYWTLNNYSGVSWCIENSTDNYVVIVYITTNPKYRENIEGRILIEVTISPINND